MTKTNGTEPFDWGTLGADWWRDSALLVGANEQQTKLACAQHRGCNQTQAASLAGYSGDKEDGSLRSAASRAVRGKAVKSLLALAEEADSDTPAVLTSSQRLAILNQMARSGDPQIKLRAIEY